MLGSSFIILGAGGHAAVVADTILSSGGIIKGFVDPAAHLQGGSVLGFPIVGADDFLDGIGKYEYSLANGLGSIKDTALRTRIFDDAARRGFIFPVIKHPYSIVATSAELENGVQVMAGAIIQPRVFIGENVVINSGAIVDHDCRVGAHSHIAPGCTLSGNVSIGTCCHVGSGVTVIQGVKVGNNATIAAGSVVVADVDANSMVMGVPARKKAQ